MPTTPNCPSTRSAPVASTGVSVAAPVRKSGRARTPTLSALAAMNAAVATRKSSPTSTAVVLVEAVVGRSSGGSAARGEAGSAGSAGARFPVRWSWQVVLYLTEGMVRPLKSSHTMSRNSPTNVTALTLMA